MLASASSTEHRSKRKFQPSITSYFAHLDDDYDAADDDASQWGLHPSPRPHGTKTPTTQLHHHHRRDSLAPVVPGPVQADLLSVGMRVRKSVPEGYKTTPTTTTTKMGPLPSIQTTLAVPRPPTLAVKPPSEPVPDSFVHQRELLPFCGLHKIGGYAEQPTTNIHLYAGLDASGARATNAFPLPAEAFTTPFSSSTGSTDSGYASTSPLRPLNPSKRSWQDDNDNAVSLETNTNFFFAIPVKGPAAHIEEVPVSPLSESPPPGFAGMPAGRLFAQPKSRRARQRADEAEEMMDVDGAYENDAQLEGRVAAGSGSDFEEADFLGREVDMGGL